MIPCTVAVLHASLLAGGLTQSVAPAEKIEINTRVTTGTGLSLAGAQGQTLRARSPVFVNLEAGMRLDRVNWLEFSGGVTMELEDRVSVGVLPRMRAYVPVRRPFSFYVLAGVPVFVHPFTLIGGQGGLGLGVHVAKRVSLVAEFTGTAYFAGTDLIEGSALGKFDAALGVNVHF